MLRDFGFGTPTGRRVPVRVPRGLVHRPDRWQPMYTRASMAMGYEFGVTPLQLAAAYAAIANDGVLLTPTLVREVRDPDGTLLYRHQPEPVRRVVTPESRRSSGSSCAARAGSGGTGEQGPAGQLRRARARPAPPVRFEERRATSGEYTASFAAIFPADDPQLVVVVKIDNPKGELLRRRRAAPVTRTMLQQALASRRVAIDRARLLGGARPRRRRRPRSARPPQPVAARRSCVSWPYRADSGRAPTPVAVPDVAGRQRPRGGARAAPAGLPGGARAGSGTGDADRTRRRASSATAGQQP